MSLKMPVILKGTFPVQKRQHFNRQCEFDLDLLSASKHKAILYVINGCKCFNI